MLVTIFVSEQDWSADTIIAQVPLPKDMPPDFVFPHRQETAEVLEFLSKIVNHWKLNYYLGLIYWNRELVTGAKELFEECGFEPDFAPFQANSCPI